MRRNILIFILLGLMAMTSCEKVVEFDVGDVKPMVTLNSKITSDSTVMVRLCYSRFFLSGAPFVGIDNAQIQLEQNGIVVPMTKDSSGFYYFGCRPQAGDTMKVDVEVPDFDRVSATTVIPGPAPFEVESMLVDTSWGETYCRIKLTMHDQPGNDYYGIMVRGWGNIYIWNDDTGYYKPTRDDRIYISSKDVVFQEAGSLSSVTSGGLETVSGTCLRFSDELFEAKDHTIDVDFSFYDYNRDLPMDQFPWSIVVIHYSEELYRYEVTSYTASNQGDVGILSEPTQIYCNINNGVGIFGSANKKMTQLRPTYGQFNHDNNGDLWKKKR